MTDEIRYCQKCGGQVYPYMVCQCEGEPMDKIKAGVPLQDGGKYLYRELKSFSEIVDTFREEPYDVEPGSVIAKAVGEVNAVLESLASARKRGKEAEEIIEKIMWSEGGGGRYCSYCGEIESLGHYPDCRIAAFLKGADHDKP